VRRVLLWCLLGFVAAGCSGGTKHAKNAAPKASPCPLIASLDQTAASVAHANVADPQGFQRTLDAAVTKYVTTVQELRTVVPANLRPDLDRLEAAVHQYRFQDAVTMRASLDAYASNNCATTGS
jgi:hypothetical protein